MREVRGGESKVRGRGDEGGEGVSACGLLC